MVPSPVGVNAAEGEVDNGRGDLAGIRQGHLPLPPGPAAQSERRRQPHAIVLLQFVEESLDRASSRPNGQVSSRNYGGLVRSWSLRTSRKQASWAASVASRSA